MRFPVPFLSLSMLGMLLLAAPLPACTSHMEPGLPPFIVHWEPDDDVNLSYGTLVLDQGLRENDADLIMLGATTLADLSPSPRPFVDAGAWLLLNRSPALARDALAPAIRRFPDDINSHLLAAEAWLEDNNVEEAVTLVEGYYSRHPDSIQARQELGVLFSKVDRFEKAVTIFEGLPKEALTPFVRYCYAKALAGVDRRKAAHAQLRLAVNEMPEFVEAWNDLAGLLEQDKEYTQAAALYEHVLEQDPTNTLAWMRLIGVYLDAGDKSSAVEVARNYTDTPGAVFTAVSLFMDRKCYDEAETLLAAMRHKPDAPEEVYFYLAAVAYEGKKDSAKALQWLEHITPANRFYPRALHFRAQLYLGQEQYAECLKALDAAQAVAPDEPALALMRGHVYTKQKQYDKALASLDAGIAQWPDNPDLRYSKGMTLDLAGRKAEAFTLMEALIAELPDYYQALNYIGYSLAEQKRELPRALELLTRADELSPDTAFILDSLAWAQHQSGSTNDAWKTILRAVKLEDGQDPVIWEHYGDIAAALGKAAEARTGYTKALEIGHEQPDAIRKKLGQTR